MTSSSRRRSLLIAALGFALLNPRTPELRLVRSWLGTWSGIWHIVAGMHRQGYDLQLTQYDERGWRATFYMTGMEHSATSATASAWEPTPWRAVQRAAWEASEVGPTRRWLKVKQKGWTVEEDGWRRRISVLVVRYAVFLSSGGMFWSSQCVAWRRPKSWASS